ncbi:phytanoyl-CoA dioxygenase family protein [Sphingomonas naphthae]|uniref:phytanoyl-CoA dioxygenase family protein n=1 Tax=Sphingomonas naphthae TaxID=1813468 RepID=UPI003B5919AF
MHPLRWLLSPLWAAALATGAKSFVDNPLIGSKRLNAAGLHAARVRLAHRMAWWRRAKLAKLIAPEQAEAFARDGFVVVPDFLSAPRFARLRDGIAAQRLPAREMQQGDAITRRIAVDPPVMDVLPELRALLRDPRWRGLNRYVGSYDSEPRVYIQTILAGHYDAPPDPQLHLHADTFHPTVKAWLFLTDVAEDEGPLTYVAGSHRITPERLAWEAERSRTVLETGDRLSQRGSLRIEPEELPALGLPPATRFAVSANTLVVADTSGFHARGASVRPSTRVEIWAYGRRNPFLPWTGLDLLSAPLVAHRRGAWYGRALDRLQRWGLAGQPWRDVGKKFAAER